MTEQKPTVGFIGIGVMGRSMAGHLLDAGYSVHVYNRTQAKAQDLVDRGAQWQSSPGKVAAAADVIITIVGFPVDVESVYLGEDGVLAQARSGSLAIDMTTSCPNLASRIAQEAAAKGIEVLDAPVSGETLGLAKLACPSWWEAAYRGLSVLCPSFEIMGKNIVHQGPAGSGQHTKMCNQIAIASGMMAISEAMAYAKKSGLQPETVLKSIRAVLREVGR